MMLLTSYLANSFYPPPQVYALYTDVKTALSEWSTTLWSDLDLTVLSKASEVFSTRLKKLFKVRYVLSFCFSFSLKCTNTYHLSCILYSDRDKSYLIYLLCDFPRKISQDLSRSLCIVYIHVYAYIYIYIYIYYVDLKDIAINEPGYEGLRSVEAD